MQISKQFGPIILAARAQSDNFYVNIGSNGILFIYRQIRSINSMLKTGIGSLSEHLTWNVN